MTRKKLITIGDSYMTPVVGKYAGTHFSELIANKLDFELICLCKQGLSNHGIAIAIEDAIKLKPDLILLGTTFHGRLIFPIDYSQRDITFDDILIENSSMLTYERVMGNTLARFGSYPAAPLHDKDTEAYYNIFKSFDKDFVNRSKAIRTYIEYLYHDGINLLVEEWILYSVLHKLHLSNINYILVYDNLPLATMKMPWFGINQETGLLDHFNKNYADGYRIELWQKNGFYQHQQMAKDEDPGYHTSTYLQTLLADVLLEKFIPNLLGE